MSDVFLKILNMSIAASWLILAVMLLRLVLKKAPKWIDVLLWGVVALRLVVPFSIQSALSLIPSAETFNAHNIQYETPAINSGIPAVNRAVNSVLGESFAPNPAGSVNPLYVWIWIASVLWLIGVAVLLAYAAISYARVRRRIAERVPYEENIFLCDQVKSPFILGLVRPNIYLPSGMDAACMEPVLAHEKAHLARRDHWWKPLGFLILSVHWFNPLCWAAYLLLCRDIELACDEKVVRQMDLEGKKRYSAALLACSAGRRLVTACPLAFGEAGVKERVKAVLRYKKPAFWAIAAALIACAAAAVCFATDPVSAEPGGSAGNAAVDRQTQDPDAGDALAAYSAFLSGERALMSEEQQSLWFVPSFHEDGMEYESACLDLDGDGLPELLVRLAGDPRGYNGVFHFEEGQIVCWNSDAAEGSCFDYPLQNGGMVRQAEFGGTCSYQLFRYGQGGKEKTGILLFAREERVPEDSPEPCPYYAVDGNEVDAAEFDRQLALLVDGLALEGTAWAPLG